MSLLEAEEISFSFDGRPVLDRVNFNLQEGEIAGLIGPNGAGKSTFIKTLAGLLKPASGKISVFGMEAEKISRKIMARDVGYLPQGETIHWPISVERIVALGRIPHLAPWQELRTEDKNGIHFAMIQTDTLHLANRPAVNLAGGEKRLVMIARVLAANPAVILADEPVAGLDPYHQIQVMELLRDLANEKRGVVAVLHDLTLAARFCDRLFLMHQGHIVSCGTPREVLSPGNLKQSYGVEARYGHHESEFYVVPWSRLS